MASSEGQEQNGASRSSQQSRAIFYYQSTKKVAALKIYFAFITLVVIGSAIYCLAIAVDRSKPVLMLADVNLLVSSFVGIILVYWYRKEVLPYEKLWYLLLFGILLAFQCVATAVFVHHNETENTVPPTEFTTTQPTASSPNVSIATLKPTVNSLY
jgi:hypothetical protein